MTALPADISRYTTDGALITRKNQAIKDADPNALDTGDREIELFFVDPADGQTIVDELFGFVSAAGRVHEAIEIGDAVGLGTIIPLFPKAPQAEIVDATRALNTLGALRGYSFDMGADSYALEFVGMPPDVPVVGTGTFDSTEITFDKTIPPWDTDD